MDGVRLKSLCCVNEIEAIRYRTKPPRQHDHSTKAADAVAHTEAVGDAQTVHSK